MIKLTLGSLSFQCRFLGSPEPATGHERQQRSIVSSNRVVPDSHQRHRWREQARLLPGRATAPSLLFHRLMLKAALADEKEAELKSYKLTNKERCETSERDC
ncbi:hypothetical protein ACHAWF_006406, partial [Thalassiosira exigua]